MNEHPKHPQDDRDDVARLVRLAGKRVVVPRDRADRVRAAAHAQWQTEVGQRSRMRQVRTVLVGAAATVLLAIGLWSWLPGPDPTPSALGAPVVEALSGTAWTAEPGSAREALEVGRDLLPGSDLVTGQDGRAAIRLASGHSLRLDSASRIRLLGDRSLALERGSVYIDSGSSEPALELALEVHTPLGVVYETGTQFEVRIEDDSVRIRLREGSVVLQHGERTEEVEVGFELTMNPDGTVVRRAIPVHGPDWAWVAEVTPMLDLDGQTARTFLDWIAREQGWQLAFTDEALASNAETIALSGTVERLTIEEALAAVLPTCRLTHRVEGGILRVSALP